MLCPRCALPAERVDLPAADSRGSIAVWQCPRCVVRAELCGAPVDVALTFWVDPQTGLPVDARSGKPLEPSRN